MKWAFWSEWEKVTTDRRMDCQNLSYLQVPILPAPSELFLPQVIASFTKKMIFCQISKTTEMWFCPERSPEMRSFVLGK